MLKQIKTKILSLISSRGFKKSLFFGIVVFIIIHFWFDTVFAEDPQTTVWSTVGTSGDSADLINSFLWFLQFIAWISASLLWALTWIISVLLDPWFTNGSAFNISVYIKEVWVFVSNLVYLIFAWILIAISFMNIIWKWEWDMFLLKKSLPKFVIWVLIVPFSWFIVQFMVSLASIMMVSVYTWPLETFKENTNLSPIMKEEVEWCSKWVINIQWNSASSSTTTTTTWTWFIECEGGTDKKQIQEILSMKPENSDYSIGWILSIYTFWIMDIESLTKLQKAQLWTLKGLSELSAKVIFDFIFVIIYLVILIALFLSLFVRVIMLWIYMMLSPLFWLLFFLWKSGSWKIAEKFNFKEFIGLVMVPVYVAGALSFWLMFTFIIALWNNNSTTTTWDAEIDLWYTILVIKGEVNGWSTSNNLLTGMWWALGALWYLMVKLFSLAFLWIAVMAALKQSSITWGIIKPIEEFGNQVWKFAMESPKYIPIPGTWWFAWWKTQNLGNLLGAWKIGMDQFDSIQRQKTQDFGMKLFPDKETKDLLDKLKGISWNTEKAVMWMKDFIASVPAATIASNATVREEFANKLKELGIKGWIKELKESWWDTKKVLEAMKIINEDSVNSIKWLNGEGIVWKANMSEDKIKDKMWSGASSSSDEAKKEGDTKVSSQLEPKNIKVENKELTDSNWAISNWKWKDLADYLVDKLWDKLEKMKYWESGFRELFSWLPDDEKALINQLKSKKVLNDDWTFNNNFKHNSWEQNSWTSSSSESPQSQTPPTTPPPTWWNPPSTT